MILFHGLKDEVVLIKFSKSVYKLFKTKNKQIIKIKKGNHSLSEKNAIVLFDDYNFINQEGVKWAVKESGINLNKCIQTQSGQLICYT